MRIKHRVRPLKKLAYLRNYRNVAGARAIAKARRSEIIPTETDVEEYVVIDADHN